MKSGPERDLVDAYAERFRKSGRALGFRGLEETELSNGGGLEAEGKRLLDAIPSGARLIRLDEHGQEKRSKSFARDLAKWRDAGEAELCFLIGGAEGFSDAVKAAAPDQMSFGEATWPHRLVRVMLAEQLYRAASILAGSPYHKA